MLTRRQIREVTIQLLYTQALLPKSTSPNIGDTELSESNDFWETLLEKEIIHHIKITRKVLLHFLQARDQPLSTLLKHHEPLLARLQTESDMAKAHADLRTVIRLESKLDQALEEIVKRKNNRKDIEPNELSNFFQINRDLHMTRELIIPVLSQDPLWAKQGDTVIANLKKLQTLSERLFLLEDPSQGEDRKEITHLRQSFEKIQGLKRESIALVNAVTAKQELIDTKLQEIVENYSLDRISHTDRAILRLATHEILHIDSIPPKVSITEAIELARTFGTTESSRFVNGVLDQLYKLTPKEDQPEAKSA